jgi:transcriptional regulator with XRE-family HTH domain
MTDRRSDPTARFAADVQRLMTARGFSAEELASRSQLTTAEVEAILRAEMKLPLDVIVLLAHALGVAPGDLIDGSV